ncbi:EF-hand calcium-binding domain-containing protein 1-like isoform X2 [Echinops telfairi]|uniref:EF-hand calcium-binding domain-containing protein 1-like isoform X2 n=1 Tax=Echinops telfairi TaxID=9371 RepID=A0AC55CYI4_ECHTE|nr:EF-hand calcium-binding domain-containing protein 1-like isoform X2 [Echinops telfairi]
MDQKALKKLVESISKTVKSFQKSEIECLLRLFNSLVKRNGKRLDKNGLDHSAFRGILHNVFGMTDDMLLDRVFFVFDKDCDSRINANEWVKGLSVFLRGTFEEKLKFCFQVYYVDGDGSISREGVFDMLKNSLHQHFSEGESEEGIKELVEITMKKMDYDNDGKISFTDFERAVKGDPLLLEVFGPCLPTAQKCLDFEARTFRSIITSDF